MKNAPEISSSSTDKHYSQQITSARTGAAVRHRDNGWTVNIFIEPVIGRRLLPGTVSSGKLQGITCSF